MNSENDVNEQPEPPNHQQTGPKADNEIALAVRRLQAFELKKAGASYREIAKQLGLSVSTIHKDVNLVLSDLKDEYRGDVNKMRDMELARLEHLQKTLWTQLYDDKGRAKPIEDQRKTVDTLLRVLKRSHDLRGLDAPERLEVNLSVVDDLAAKLAQLALRFVPEDQHKAYRVELAKILTEFSGEEQQPEGPAPEVETA